MIVDDSACSSTCAHHPTTRLTANVGVNISRGTPASCMTTPAQNSTFARRSRPGRYSASSASVRSWTVSASATISPPGRSASSPGDLALAAVQHVHGMRADAGEAIFAVARTVGWIAHALEQYADPGLRFRVEGSYVGRRPL